MRAPRGPGGVLAMLAVSTRHVAAQAPGKPVTGNPTPGTEQPAPPDLSDHARSSAVSRPLQRAAQAKAPRRARRRSIRTNPATHDSC